MAQNILMGMQVFTKVVELKSFAKAADKLDMSRGMASRYVSQVEEHLGVRLINRTTRHLSLTEAGSAYYEKAMQVLALVAETEHMAENDVAAPRGTLRITSSQAFGGSLLGEVMSAYLKENPEVKIRSFLCERMVDLVDEGYDLALRVADTLPPGLIARPFTTIRMVVCAAPEYLQRHGTPSHPHELTSHNTLNFADSEIDKEWTFKKDGESVGVKLQGNFFANNGNILCNAAVGGLGIVYQPTFLVHEHLRSGRLVRLFDDWQTDEMKAYIVYPNRKFLLPKVRTFIDFIVDYFGDEPYWDRGIIQR